MAKLGGIGGPFHAWKSALGGMLILATLAGRSEAQVRPLWGGLKPGPHAVGFRSSYKLDHARQYDQGYAPDGGPPAPKRPRPILVNVWHPAKPSGKAPMLHGAYLDQDPDDARVAAFSRKLMDFMRRTISEEVLEERPLKLDATEVAAIARLMATPTAAARDVPPEDGRFPVVVNHQGLGGTIEDNSVFFEYLASHGYVVVNSAYMSENASYLNVDWDLDRSVKDMDFLLRTMSEQPYADLDRVGAVGQSYGAQAVLAWRAEANSVVDAVVSLDSTVEYGSLADAFVKLKPRVERPENLSVPLLLFAQAAEKPNFRQWDFLKYARRYEVAVDHLDHNDFISQGAIRGDLLPGRRFPAEKQASVRATYESVCELARTFLDAYVKRDGSAEDALKPARAGLVVHCVEPARLPPTSGQLADLAAKQSPKETRAVVKSFGTDLNVQTLSEASFGLRQAGKIKEAVSLLTTASEVRPSSWIAARWLAEALAEAGDKPAAVRTYHRALELAEARERRTSPDEKWDDPKPSDRAKARIRSELKALEAEK